MIFLMIGGFAPFVGCGATRSTDTLRTATEQLLISDAIDRAVQSLNLQPLSGQTVYLDDSKLSDTVDRNYFISTLRQQLLASGCDLQEKREAADFIVEARAGAIGTDRNDLLFGIPSMNVPQIPLVQPVPAAIPEIPIAKRKDQRGVAKIAVFAYHRSTGAPVWQSGIVRQESSANDVWIFGTGPFQHGTIYDHAEFAGKAIPSQGSKNENEITPRRMPAVSLNQESMFKPPQQFAKKETPTPEPKVALASHAEAAPTAKPIAKPIATVPSPADQASVTTNAAPTAQQIMAQLPAFTPFGAAKPGGLTLPAADAASTSSSVIPPLRNDAAVNAAVARMGGSTPLPQPRFNSPQ
jgi:hypothetical protein